MNPVAIFLDDLQKKGLLETGDSILLAVSGGMDSVVLAHFWAETNRPFGLIHVNFQLRGAESDGDEAFVKQLAERLHVPFFVQKMETTAFAKQHGISIQMAARVLRYAFFEQIRAENGYKFIATGHHADDNLETAMLHFFRGTGLRGLRGMLPVNEKLIRPLLHISRAELKKRLLETVEKPAWREDSSNAKSDYHRNFVRHEIVPLIDKINPGFWPGVFLENMERARQAELLLEKTVAEFSEKWIQLIENQTVIGLDELAGHPARRLLLEEILRPFGFHGRILNDLNRAIDGPPGRQFFSEKHRLVIDRNRFLVGPRDLKNESVELTEPAGELILPNGRFVWFEMNSKQPNVRFVSTENARFALLSLEKCRFPLRIRHWQPGDFFHPSGMNGHRKKLQDFFTDLKFSRPEKEQTWLLENADGELLWVVGHRVDELAAWQSESVFMRFEWTPNYTQLIENE